MNNAARDGQWKEKNNTASHGISEFSSCLLLRFSEEKYTESCSAETVTVLGTWSALENHTARGCKMMQAIVFLQEALQIPKRFLQHSLVTLVASLEMFHEMFHIHLGAFSSTSIRPTSLSSASMSIQHTDCLGWGQPAVSLPGRCHAERWLCPIHGGYQDTPMADWIHMNNQQKL